MGSLFLWLVIGYFVFKKLGNVLQQVAQEHQEQMERQAELELEEDSVDEYPQQEEPIFETPREGVAFPPPLIYQPIERPPVEGGHTMKKVDELTSDKEGDAEESASQYSASHIREHIREGIVMKEILDRKHF